MLRVTSSLCVGMMPPGFTCLLRVADRESENTRSSEFVVDQLLHNARFE